MNRRKQGDAYESLAARFLEQAGYQILERNFRCPFGEIDLIARDQDELVFVEVKYRRTSACGYPEEAVHVRKQKAIRKTADFFCTVKQTDREYPCRFDIISILGKKIRHIKNAFPYG